MHPEKTTHPSSATQASEQAQLGPRRCGKAGTGGGTSS